MIERTKNIDVALVYELWNEYAAAVNSGDMERWNSLWIKDSLQMPPGAPTRVGQEQIRRQMQPLFDQFNTNKMAIHTEEVRIFRNQAYAHGTYKFELTSKGAGRTMCYSGKFLSILEKQIDGSWKIAIDCHNYDAPSENENNAVG